MGTYAGSGWSSYLFHHLYANPNVRRSLGDYQTLLGSHQDFLTTRVSYKLNLKGPSIDVQTACSTSLVAVQLACQSLLTYQCDMALAGGISIYTPQATGYLYQDEGIFPPDGHCRAFDAQAQGTVSGNGGGIVILKRLQEALADGDTIHAVIKGAAINNDGSLKIGYTAPSVEGQKEVISEAIALAGIHPDTIQYIEAHGTGTPLGDPIELAALTQAFQTETQRQGCCAIGSVKTNIGHLDTAAGVASLIKVIQSLKHRELPPTLHFSSPNPQIDFETSPFYVNASLRPWDRPDATTPRRAAVNSLGVGGTNAFVVVEEAPASATPVSGPSRPQQLFLLSAKTAVGSETAATKLGSFLADHPDLSLADVAFTLSTKRRAYPHRRCIVADSLEAAVASLSDPGRQLAQVAAEVPRRVTFLFPGGGAQHPGMARDLYTSESVFRAAIDRGLAWLNPRVDFELQRLLYPAPGEAEAAEQELQKGSRALPALFMTSFALAELYRSWGIVPSALLGHSMGEYVAACLAGVLSMEDALGLVLLRGQLFESLERGAMLSVPLAADDLRPHLGDELDLAVINGPSAAVASGPANAIEALEQKLSAMDLDVRRVRIDVAAHSRMLDPILDAFRQYVTKIELSPPSLPLLSNVTGTWMEPEQATDPEYWVRHLRQTVRFGENLEVALADPDQVMLEVAPGRTLTSLVKAHPSAGLGRPVLQSLRHRKEEVADTTYLLGVVGRLWLSGVDVDFDAFFAREKRHRVELPTYAWDHQRYWIDPGKSVVAPPARSLRKKLDVAEWFYQPTWNRSLLPASPADRLVDPEEGAWLVFVDDTGFGEQWVDWLRGSERVMTVRPGADWGPDGDSGYTVRLDQQDDYHALWSALVTRGLVPRRILHLWSLAEGQRAPQAAERGFFSLLYLAQAMGREGLAERVTLGVVTNRLQSVAAGPIVAPERATVFGPAKVMMQEVVGLTTRCIDVELPGRGSWREAHLFGRLREEMTRVTPDHVVAFRGSERFVQAFAPCPLEPASEARSRIRRNGTYLITGGFGGLGMTLARHLASRYGAGLILVGRTAVPAEDTWEERLEGADERTAQRIRDLQALRELGAADVLAVAADVASMEQMIRVVARARERFGGIDGVFHTAGVLDDGIMQLKRRSEAEAVLRPKVAGTPRPRRRPPRRAARLYGALQFGEFALRPRRAGGLRRRQRFPRRIRPREKRPRRGVLYRRKLERVETGRDGGRARPRNGARLPWSGVPTDISPAARPLPRANAPTASIRERSIVGYPLDPG
ncbi:MAG: type I polyketide synthase [Myxococcota bacterium]